MVNRILIRTLGCMAILGHACFGITFRGWTYDRLGNPVTSGTVHIEVHCHGFNCDGSGPGNDPYQASMTLSGTGVFEFNSIPALGHTAVISLQTERDVINSANQSILLDPEESNIYVFQMRGFHLRILNENPKIVELNQTLKTEFPEGNLVVNSSFENESHLFHGQSPRGWVGRWGGIIERVEGTAIVPAVHGRFSLKVSLGSASAEGQHEGAKYLITEEDPAFATIATANSQGQGFTFTAWVKAAPEAVGKTIVMGNVHTQGDVDAYTFSDQNWHRISHFFSGAQVHPNTFAFRYYGFSVHEADNSSNVFSFYLDNVSLVAGNQSTSGPTLMTQELSDGEGRILQRHAMAKDPATPGYSREVLRTDFDEIARPSKSWLPFSESCTGAGCWKVSTTDPNSAYQGGGNGLPNAGGFAYSEPVYENDPLARSFQSSLPGALYQPQHGHLPKIASSATSSLSETDLGANRANPTNTANPAYSYTHMRDGNGNESMLWKDQLGNVVKNSGYDWDENGFVSSRRLYNEKGQLIRTLPPISCQDANGNDISGPNCVDPTEYSYTQLGKTKTEKSPDFGEIRFAYNVAGELRARQSEAQRAAGEFTVYKYDELSRLVETGTYQGDLSEVENPNYFENAIAGSEEEDNPAKWSFLTLIEAYDAVTDAVADMTRFQPVSIYQVVQNSGEEVTPPPGTEFTPPIDENGNEVELDLIGTVSGSPLHLQLRDSRGDGATVQGLEDRAWPYADGNYQVQIRYVYDDIARLPSDVRIAGVPFILPPGENAGFSQGRLVAAINYNPHLSGAGYSLQTRIVSSVFKYDKFGNIISDFKYLGAIHDANHRIQESEHTYDVSNRKVTQTVWKESGGASCADMSSFHRFTYDGFGRLDKVYTNKSTDCNVEEQLAAYRYFPDGKVNELEVIGLSGHRMVVKYSYHIRGWLSSIVAKHIHCPPSPQSCTETPFYSQNLKYDENLGSDIAVPQYNGNLAENLYYLGRVADSRHQVYLYDGLNRLKAAMYESQGSEDDLLDGEYAYLADGRFKTLKRGGVEQTVAQPYRYHNRTNRLKCVDDVIDSEPSYQRDRSCTGVGGSVARYDYDLDGNLLEDKARQYSIDYDWRGLPWRFTFEDKSLIMVYDADGNRVSKIEKSVNAGGQPVSISGKHYIGGNKEIREPFNGDPNIEINNLKGAGLLGRIRADGARDFYVSNHLGSLVTSMTESGSWQQQAMYDYFPYGKQVEHAGDPNIEITEGFTGKELDDGIDLVYFGARYYDADLGVWISPDPGRQYHSLYAYSPNPINGLDPDGMDFIRSEFYYTPINPNAQWAQGVTRYYSGTPDAPGEVLGQWLSGSGGSEFLPGTFADPIPPGNYSINPKDPRDVSTQGEGWGKWAFQLFMTNGKRATGPSGGGLFLHDDDNAKTQMCIGVVETKSTEKFKPFGNLFQLITQSKDTKIPVEVKSVEREQVRKEVK